MNIHLLKKKFLILLFLKLCYLFIICWIFFLFLFPSSALYSQNKSFNFHDIMPQNNLQTMPEASFLLDYLNVWLNGDREKALDLVKNDRNLSIQVINLLLDMYVDMHLGNNQQAEFILKMSAQIASDYQRIFTNDYYINRFAIYRSWSHKQMLEKNYADSLKQEADTLNNYNIALSKMLACERIYNTIGEDLRAGYTQWEIGHLYVALDILNEALNYYKKAARVFYNADAFLYEVRALNNIGDTYEKLGMLKNAEREFLIALDKARFIDNKEWEGKITNNLIVVYQNMKNYEVALQHAHIALKIANDLCDERGKAAVLGNIANIYTHLGQYEKALEYNYQVLEIFEKLGLQNDMVRTLSNIKSIKVLSNKINEAMEISVPKIRSDSLLSNDLELNRILSSNEVLYKSLYSSIDSYEKLIETHRKAGDKFDETIALNNLGVAYYLCALELSKINPLRENYIETAIKMYRESIEISKKYNYLDCLANSYVNLGSVFEKLNNIQEAKICYQEAIKNIELIRSFLSEEELSLHFFKNRDSAYEYLISLSLDLHEQGETPKNNDDLHKGNTFEEIAFHYSEGLKTRAFAEILSTKMQKVPMNIPEEIIKEEQELNEKLKDLQAIINQGQFYNDVKLKLAKIELKNTIAKYENFKDSLWQRFPKYATLKYTNPIYLNQINLRKNEILLDYVVMEDETVLFIICDSKIKKTIRISKSREDLSKLIDSFLNTNTIPNKFNYSICNKLFQLLISNGLDGLSYDNHLIIVPDDILNRFPFEVLIINQKQKFTENTSNKIDNFDNVNFLGKLWEISYYQSATILNLIRASRKINTKWDQEIFVVADQSFENEAMQIVSSLDTCRNLDHLKIGKEINEIDIKKYITEKNIKYIHFSSHGILIDDPLFIEQPCIILNNIVRSDSLKMSEILTLNINSELVTLSACQTGRGEDITGEGLINFSRSFMYAGVPSVVVSLWDVDANATNSFMRKFYHNLKLGMNKAEALRKTKQWMIEFSYQTDEFGNVIKHDHIYYWAPFILIGEYD